MPTTKTNAPSFLTLPVEMREKIYDHCGKDTLAKLTSTCRQTKEEIDSVVDDQGKRARSPWDALRKRNFPEIAVPETLKLKSASVIYRTVEAIFPTFKKIESLKAKAKGHRATAERFESSGDMGMAFLAQNPTSQAKEADEEVERLLNELKSNGY
jgi:hypothetical protein